ncbi:sensor domain-containing diguanylate cyclase [Hartmannibacter diazotrophicus]|nr:diguanylate cyclase [Hartmannibacter diazotrophicus]
MNLHPVLLALCGFLAGPVAATLAAVVAGAGGILLKTEPFIGIYLMTAAATAVGIAAHHLLHGRRPTERDLLWLAILLSTGAMVGEAVLYLARADGNEGLLIPLAGILTFVAALVSGLTCIAEEARREATAATRFFRAIVDTLPDGLSVKDKDGRFLAANPATARHLGADRPADVIGRTDFDYLPIEIARKSHLDEQQVVLTGQPMTFQQTSVSADGRSMFLSSHKSPLRDEIGKIVGIVTHNRDVTEKKKLESQYQESQQLLADAFAFMADGLVIYDGSNRIVFSNNQFRELFPRTSDLRVPGTSLEHVLRAAVQRGEETPSGDLDDWIQMVLHAGRTNESRQFKLGDGRWIEVRDRRLANGGFLSVVSDISKSKLTETTLATMNRQLAVLAETDGLTGLGNRRAFEEKIEREFAHARDTGSALSLLFVDIDVFKAYNDTYGHLAGDDCIRRIASCLRGICNRPVDLVARYGGEELVAILPNCRRESAFVIAEGFRVSIRQLAMPHVASEKGLVTISGGLFTMDRLNPAGNVREMIKRADDALYQAKRTGRDCVISWQPFENDDMDVDVDETETETEMLVYRA